MDHKENSEIQTFSGKVFDVLNPTPEDVCIEDIAHALSLQCRFNGHIREFYSVAQHCVRVSQECPPEFQLWGLLHDAAETYIGDMVSPLKHQPEMARFRTIEKRLMVAICSKFNLDWDNGKEPPQVKTVDKRMFLTEARDLRLGGLSKCCPGCEPFDDVIWPWPPSYAEDAFLRRYRYLVKPLDVSFSFGHNVPVCSKSQNEKESCG